jgi:outer membrane protein OmpA-like peptidoglycan-associated protein
MSGIAGPRHLALAVRLGALALLLATGCAAKQKPGALEAELGASGFETRVDDRGVTVLVTDVLFDFDSDALTPEGEASVGKIAEIVKRLAPENELICEGHTDARGTETYNFELSLRRARRVAEALEASGIPTERISTQGLGESRPLVAERKPDGGDDPEGRARNRRVEVVIAKAQ